MTKNAEIFFPIEMQTPHVQGKFCAEFGLVDNLVAEDRHEIGCESLESHFHKEGLAQGVLALAQTRG